MFADTGTHPVNSTDHDEVDFFASSVAIDQGRLAAPGVPPVMVDHPGEYDDATPVQRGFVGYTEGEYAFTVDQEQYGNRYALWPESGITYLDSTRAVHWAAIVYVCAPCQNVFSTAGNTLLEITVDPIGGPHAERVVTELFGQNETQYGTVAGVRSWGSEGPGGMDGYVYAIATVSEGFSGGLLLSRVTPENVADKSSYEYYLNSTRSWSSTPPNATDPSADFFLAGAYANLDLLYSPRHLSWVLVYETPYADNRFYYQVLKATEPILPSYAGGNYDDIVTAVYEFPWSDPILLFQAPTPANGHYVYGGGVNPGYFDDDDFVNGGTKMLVHWSEPLAYGDWHEYYTVGTAGLLLVMDAYQSTGFHDCLLGLACRFLCSRLGLVSQRWCWFGWSASRRQPWSALFIPLDTQIICARPCLFALHDVVVHGHCHDEARLCFLLTPRQETARLVATSRVA